MYYRPILISQISDPPANALRTGSWVYSIHNTATNFNNADVLCKMINAHLVALETKAELDAFNSVNPLPVTWLYAGDKRNEGQYIFFFSVPILAVYI